MSIKQDGAYPRTPADLERKYQFGQSFSEIMGIANGARKTATEAKEAVENLDEELTPDEIFNRLTQNGAMQGIFKDEDGQIYINAEYIQAIEKLFAKDILMSGTLSFKTKIKFRPDEEAIETLRQHILGNITIPNELIPIYDYNGDGNLSLGDLGGLRLLNLGEIDFPDRYTGAKETDVELTIDLKNPEKFIHYKGKNMWGRDVEGYIGTNFTSIKNPETEQKLNDLYYKDGDTMQIKAYCPCQGLLTGSRKRLNITIPTEKRMDNIKSIDFYTLKGGIRHSDGGYIINDGGDISGLGTITLSKATNNLLWLKIDLSTASTFTNNAPVAVSFDEGTEFVFHE